jgi:allophanate hydrolase
MSTSTSLAIASLLETYRSGRDTPQRVLDRLLAAPDDGRHVWIARLGRDQVRAYAAALDPAAIDRLPLYGIPFVIKDNIDLAGVPTTAGCAAYAYTPAQSAAVVQRLIEAGAIPLGKTNLDQFATGLVGTRSPYGACRNSVDADYISGGSSSGSAVAVAVGLASFALGTDTAGSGRVPAAFNNLIGLKPSNGRLSSRGVVPACRSLDCVSIFALTADDAERVLAVAQGFDAEDVYSRAVRDSSVNALRIAVPRRDQRQFFGDAQYQRLFAAAVDRLPALGAQVLEVDFEPFFEAARLLYEGPWIAERYAAVGAFIEAHRDAVLPVTRTLIEAGQRPSAVSAFEGAYRLQALKRRSAAVWSNADLLMTPTAGTIYRRREVDADPIRLNANLGFYTNFMNLFELCGVAVPAGFRADGLPFGVTLVGPSQADRALLRVAGRLHRAWVSTLGALGVPIPPPAHPAAAVRDGYMALAVCGAHMEGLPLNHQLRERGGYFIRAATTAHRYRLFALPPVPRDPTGAAPAGLVPPGPARPGLVRSARDGAAIALEVWALPTHEVGAFLAGIPAPLGLGQIELDSGERVTGFLCESDGTAGATDITAYGGWRHYLKGPS